MSELSKLHVVGFRVYDLAAPIRAETIRRHHARMHNVNLDFEWKLCNASSGFHDVACGFRTSNLLVGLLRASTWGPPLQMWLVQDNLFSELRLLTPGP